MEKFLTFIGTLAILICTGIYVYAIAEFKNIYGTIPKLFFVLFSKLLSMITVIVLIGYLIFNADFRFQYLISHIAFGIYIFYILIEILLISKILILSIRFVEKFSDFLLFERYTKVVISRVIFKKSIIYKILFLLNIIIIPFLISQFFNEEKIVLKITLSLLYLINFISNRIMFKLIRH